MSCFGICDECNGINLIINVREGEIVCRDCGLVKETKYLDDTCVGNMTYHDMESNFTPTYKDTTYNGRGFEEPKTEQSIKAVIEEMLQCDGTYHIVHTANNLYHEAFKSLGDKRGARKRAIMAAAVHCAFKIHRCGISPLDVYLAFDVEAWLDYSSICMCWRSLTEYQKIMMAMEREDCITRMVYANDKIPLSDAWKITKVSIQLRDKVECYLKSRTKASKLTATLIYIACGIIGCKLSHDDVQRLYDVTPMTLKKHERLVQEALKACRQT